MRNVIIKIIIIVYFAFFNLNDASCFVEAENYKLISFDNKECSVSLELDLVKEYIKVILDDNEVLYINGFMGLEQKVNILNNKFLELRIKTRGGSGIAMRRFILICISDNKLVKAIDIISMISSEFKESYVPCIDSLKQYDEKSIYSLTFTIKQKGNGFKLIAVESEKVQSKMDPSKNHDTKDLLQFNFDMNMKIFYNHIEGLSGVFTIDSDDGNPTFNHQFREGEYPTIKLKKGKYYYIDHVWYINDSKDHLTKFSNTCD